MREVEEKFWANPSALYGEALEAKKILTESREKIARILNCQKNDIVFTSGGTEGNNLALLGVFEACCTSTFTPHIVTTAIEHSSVLETCKEIERRGGEVTYVSVDENGLVNPKDIAKAIKENTVLVSVMYANNEIGTIQPIKEIGRTIKQYRKEYRRKSERENDAWPYLHTDACQGFPLTLDTQSLGVDLITLDGIKMYGPRGAGILYVKPDVAIMPVLFGGGQERGLRSGTENVASAVGLAEALEIADRMREKESARMSDIRDYAIEKILKTFPNVSLNGSRTERLPNNINICFPGLDAEFAVVSLDVLGISASYSSSCRTLAEDSSSYVISALQKSYPHDVEPKAATSVDGFSALGKSDCSLSSLRFTLGRESTRNDMDALVIALKKIMVS